MMTWPFIAVVVVICVLALLTNRSAYRNGFWDGVIWERDRDGRVFPEHTCDPVADSGDCMVCRRPGSESLYPSKPDPSWHGWASLAAGARQREEEKPEER